MSNKKVFFFVMLSILLIYGLTQVSATDNMSSSNMDLADTIHDTSVKENMNSQLSQEITDNKLDANDKVLKSNIASKNISKEEKNIKTSRTLVITNETFDTYFTNKYLNDMVSDGDVLDFRGSFYGDNYSMYINKAVNITSSTQDAYISLNTSAVDWFGGDDVAAFTIVKEGAYTNVSDIYFFNSQIFVKNSHHIIFNNISAIADSSTVGRGVGQTSIRDNSSFVTVENSTFSTKDQWGGCGLVLAWANNCTIRYNTLYGIGEAGNLFYLTTFNVDNLPFDANGNIDYSIINVNNTFESNVLIGPDHPQAMCYVICLSGTNNRIVNNTVLNYTGYGINVQAYSFDYDMKTLIANNTLLGSSFFMPNGSIIINNTVTGNFTMGTRSIIENNTFTTIKLGYDNMALTNTKAENIIVNNMNQNITIENCTVTGNITIKGSSTLSIPGNVLIKNNTVGENILIGGASNITVVDNDIKQQIVMTSRNNANVTIVNNTIINNEDYTITADKKVKGLNISDNYLLTDTFAGNDTVNLLPLYDDYIVQNDKFKLNDTNYLRFFNDDATLRDDIPQDKLTFEIDGNMYNKKFIFTNGSINLTNPHGYTLYNTSVEVSHAQVEIDGLILENNNMSFVSIDSATDIRIMNSYFNSNNNEGIVINNSRNVLVDNNYIKTIGDYSIQIVNSSNVNVTNNALYAKNQEGDASVNVVESTADVHDNNVLNNILTIKGNLTVYMPCRIELKVTDLNDNPIKYGNIVVSVNNVNYPVNYVNGQATLNYTPQNMNDVNITATYTSPNMLKITKNTSLKVKAIDTKITLTQTTALVNQQITINATIKDAMNNNVKDGTISFTDNTGKTWGTFNVTDGKASTTLKYTKTGNYNITANYTGTTTYKTSTNKTTITINQINLAIKGDLTVFTPSTIKVNITNQNNNPITTGTIEIYINNKKQNATFKNAIATCSYTPQNTNKINITAIYNTPDKFTVTQNTTMNVNKIDTRITLTQATALVNQQITINATIKDALNNNVKDGTISFTDNTGKTWGTFNVTDGKASATLKYTKTGNYNITANYTGTTTYKTSTNKTTITINQINLAIKGDLTVFTPSTIKVNITNQNNNPITTGSLEIYINNKKQNTTFKNAIATCSYTPQNTNKINISAIYNTPDKFTVTQNTTMNVNKIGTKLTITTNNRTPRVNEKVKLTVTLKDNNNNSITNQKITIDVNNKDYNLTTNKTGMATLDIAMNKNNKDITATAKYNGNTSYLQSNSNITLNRSYKLDMELLTGSFDTKPGDTVKLIAHINDNGVDINGGQLVFKLNGLSLKDEKGNAVIVQIVNGLAVLEYKIPDSLGARTHNLTAVYASTTYGRVELTTPMTINKFTTHIDINPIITRSDKITVNAQVVDQNNQALNKQTTIALKINGKSYTLTTTNGSINYQLTQSLKDGYYNITLISGENGKYMGATAKTVLIKTNNTIKTNYINNTLNTKTNTKSGDTKTSKILSILTGSSMVKPGDRLKLIAHLSEDEVDINGGQLVFKLNGLSLKDEDGKAVVVNIKDGLGILDYKIPDTLGARTHNLTAVYASSKYGRVELSTELTMNRLNTHIDAEPLFTKSATAYIKAEICDDNNQLINRQTDIVIKIDGKSYSMNCSNGKINFKIPTTLTSGVHQVTIIVGENGKYLSSRLNTVVIKT